MGAVFTFIFNHINFINEKKYPLSVKYNSFAVQEPLRAPTQARTEDLHRVKVTR